jgi:hypothetical protein
MEGSGQIITDPDPEGPKTYYGTGSRTLDSKVWGWEGTLNLWEVEDVLETAILGELEDDPLKKGAGPSWVTLQKQRQPNRYIAHLHYHFIAYCNASDLNFLKIGHPDL